MSLFRQTLQIALAGVQAPLPPSLAALSDESGAADGPAAQLLQAAALLTQAERSARPLPRSGGESRAVAPAETLSAAHADIAEVLRQALRAAQPNPWVLDDAAALLVRRREHFPHLLLPAWLDAVLPRPEAERVRLMACTGQRGPWLAAMNPDWQALGGRSIDDTLWETGSLAERAAWLGATRAASPDAGRAALEAIWAQASPDEREKFLPCLRTGLSMHDEPFLEAARADKRRDVRRAAVTLLALLPDSQFVQRMLARLAEWLVHTPGGLLRGAKLEVRLPAAYDKSWALDGIPEKTTRQHQKIGDKANWLIEAIGNVPLDRLLLALQMPVATWAKLIDAHEFAAALWIGSADSFERNPRVELLPALAATPLLGPRNSLLGASLREAHRTADLARWLGPWMEGGLDLAFALPLMPALDSRWSRRVLQQVRGHVDKHRGQSGYWSELLPRCSERLHPALLGEWIAFIDPLGNEPYAGKAWASAIEIATLRHKLHSFFPPTERP